MLISISETQADGSTWRGDAFEVDAGKDAAHAAWQQVIGGWYGRARTAWDADGRMVAACDAKGRRQSTPTTDGR